MIDFRVKKITFDLEKCYMYVLILVKHLYFYLFKQRILGEARPHDSIVVSKLSILLEVSW